MKRAPRKLTQDDILARYAIPEPNSGCWLWEGATASNGYGRISIGNRRVQAHRFVWEIANGQSAPDDLQVHHSCDNPPCVNPAHLSVGTPRKNTQDMIARGRRRFTPRCGEKSPVNKYPESLVLEIFYSPLSNAEAAKKYGVSRSHAGGIKSGRKWGWLTKPLKEAGL